MASHDNGDDVSHMSLQNNNNNIKPVSTIVIFIAMRSQAVPLMERFHLTEDTAMFPQRMPWVRYHGTYKDLHINMLWPGTDTLGVDSIGKVSAALVTYAAIQALKPDLIINAGISGGLKSRGASVGDVFLASHAAFHDRRIPTPGRHLYAIGMRRALSTPVLSKELNLKVVKLSTGSSLVTCPRDEALIIANDATVKDMEGAAIAYVAEMFKIPFIFLKVVTHIVDDDKPTAEECLEHFTAGTHALDHAVTQVIEFINGKSLSEL